MWYSQSEYSFPTSPESSESLVHDPPIRSGYPTYKLVGDNIDKHVKPREMRVDVPAETLHFVNVYAVHDRVDMSKLPDSPLLPDIGSIAVEDPTAGDHKAISNNSAILAGHVLKKYMPFFTRFCIGFGEAH
jgi:hypothetical protein